MYTLAHEISTHRHKRRRKKERLTSGVAYHYVESFALLGGNIVYNHPLFLKEHRPICNKLRNHASYKNQGIQSDDREKEIKIYINIKNGWIKCSFY
jgi:hypothetical protein